MKNSLRIHKWTHNEFNIFILGVLTHPLIVFISSAMIILPLPFYHYVYIVHVIMVALF